MQTIRVSYSGRTLSCSRYGLGVWGQGQQLRRTEVLAMGVAGVDILTMTLGMGCDYLGFLFWRMAGECAT